MKTRLFSAPSRAALAKPANAGQSAFPCRLFPEAIEFCTRCTAASRLERGAPALFWIQDQPLVVSLSRCRE
ncbi:MAG: hypothetical protein JO069_21645 [Verrucomicrobia bacterium]|nr:hypothetical protein [Verrucomicrobiota bacterium]